MSNYTETNTYRQKKRIAVQAGTAAPQPTEFVFGGGGHDDEDAPLEANPSQTALNDIFGDPVAITKLYNEDNYSITCLCELDPFEFVNALISEIGLLDQDGDLICFMNTEPRTKEPGGLYTVRVKIKF